MTRSSLPPLLIYLEDAPVRSGLAATGLSKAFNAMFMALVLDSARVCVVQTHEMVDQSYFVEGWLAQPTWATPRADWVLAKLTARLPWFLAHKLARIHGLWICYRLRRAMKDQLPPGTRIFAPIGTDPLTLVRVESLAHNLSAHLEFYFVDDLESHPSNRGWKAELRNILNRLLPRAARVYCITDGLSVLMNKRYAVQPQTLNLVAAKTCDPTHHTRPNSSGAFAFFLGSINHLYADGLRLLMHIVAELRNLSGENLTIRLCSTHTQVREQLGEVPAWVLVGRIEDDVQIQRELASATFCFMPYSFEEKAKSMVESSFPSKMIDYLANANAILVYAPENTAPYQLLRDNNLPYACNAPDMLQNQIYNLLSDRPMLSARYRCLLDEKFSVSAMRRTLRIVDCLE